jgi:hypothetical protein
VRTPRSRQPPAARARRTAQPAATRWWCESRFEPLIIRVLRDKIKLDNTHNTPGRLPLRSAKLNPRSLDGRHRCLRLLHTQQANTHTPKKHTFRLPFHSMMATQHSTRPLQLKGRVNSLRTSPLRCTAARLAPARRTLQVRSEGNGCVSLLNLSSETSSASRFATLLVRDATA